METNNTMREEHNRRIQKDIDKERDEINRIKKEREKMAPEIQKVEARLQELKYEDRKLEIQTECNERSILVLSEKFWKN